MARTSRQRIPTNVITGFLGSGKTTAIAKLVEQRAAGEKWSIFVNEFGSVSIDQALVDSESDSVEVQELSGGCACCAQSVPFQPLLAQFIRRTKPDRLILEPTGAGHPARIVEILRGPSFAKILDVRNIICLIDPKDFDDAQRRDTIAFQDQLQLAEIVLLNWTDHRDRALIDRCRDWLEGLRPPKQLILETSFGAMDLDLLDLEFEPAESPLSILASPPPEKKQALMPILAVAPNTGSQLQNSDAQAEAETPSVPAPRRPVRIQNEDAEYQACGWIFDPNDVFDRDKLIDLLVEVHPIARLKGVFRCEDDWWSINRAKDETTYLASTYRRDSRLEIILDSTSRNWAELESELLRCLVE